MQFWINLPSYQKVKKPQYLAIQNEDVPEINLPNNEGVVRVLIGEFQNKISKIPIYSKLFLYHIKLNAKKTYSFDLRNKEESALVLIKGEKAIINDKDLNINEMAIFDIKNNVINITNNSDKVIDVLLFGGEPYDENIVFGGPFVMNTKDEIILANKDFHLGKYGEI